MTGVIYLKRVPIRDPHSLGKNKQRICDYIRMDDGTEKIEFKDGKQKPTISVDDFLMQLNTARATAQR